MSPKPKSPLLAAAKRLGLWCGIGTAVLTFLVQGVAVGELLWSRAQAEQQVKDRLTAVESAVTDLRRSFDSWKSQGPSPDSLRSAAQVANK